MRLATFDTEIAGIGLRKVRDLNQQSALLKSRRSGRIVTESGGFKFVAGRWWPHIGNLLQVHLDSTKRPHLDDRCELFFHEPFSSPGFITLSYVRSTAGASLSTFYAATLVLDEIARLKGSAAIVCHLTNDRLSNRLLHRWGWQRHCEHLSGRHFIKRFYGDYPDLPSPWETRLYAHTPPSQETPIHSEVIGTT